MIYSEKIIEQIRKLKLKGVSNKKICKKLGINETTFYQWKNDKPEFSKMLEDCHRVISDDLDESLLKLAKGMTLVETTKEPIILKGEMVSPKLRITKKVTKHIAPNINAIQYYKNNMDPIQWRDRKNVEHTGEVELKHSIPPEVRELLNEVKKIEQD